MKPAHSSANYQCCSSPKSELPGQQLLLQAQHHNAMELQAGTTDVQISKHIDGVQSDVAGWRFVGAAVQHGNTCLE